MKYIYRSCNFDKILYRSYNFDEESYRSYNFDEESYRSYNFDEESYRSYNFYKIFIEVITSISMLTSIRHIQWLSKLTNHLRKEKCSIFIVPTKGARDVKLSLCCRALLVVCLVSVSIKSFLSFIFLFRKNKKVRNFFASKLTNQNTKTIFQM